MTSYIHEQGAALASLGYLVCAIAPGSKRPEGAAWGDHPLSEEECVDYREAKAGAGIICGKGENAVYGLDFDVEEDAEFAEDLVNWLSLYFDKIGGALLKRTGKPPKFLIPVCGKAGMRKTATEFFRKGDAKARLEILGEGQQFVAYHIHPSTGEPYKWERISDAGMWSTDQSGPDCTELCKARPEDLAWIDEKAVADIKAKFAELAEKHGWSRESRERAMNIDEDAALANELTPEQIPFYSFDLVTMNPPYIAPNAGYENAQDSARIARHEVLCSLDDVIACADKLLRFGGTLCICQRPERLADAICAMRAHAIEPKRLLWMIHTFGKKPSLFLLEGKKGANSGMVVPEPLILKDEYGQYTPQALRVYGLYQNERTTV